MFNFLKRTKEISHSDLLNQAIAASDYRAKVNRIVISRNLNVSVSAALDDKHIYEAATIASFIVEDSIKRPGYHLEQLDEIQIGFVAIVLLVAAGHVSRVGNLKFEMISRLAFIMTFSPATNDKNLFRLSSDVYNWSIKRKNSPQYENIMAFGQLVQQFFDSNDDLFLNMIGLKLFGILNLRSSI